MSLIKRVGLFNYYEKLFNENKDIEKKNLFNKKSVLGQGGQGKVYQYCTKDICEEKKIAIKKFYLEKKESKYINTIFNKKALTFGIYIEISANQLLNQLILQSISPNFVLNYGYDFQERTGICNDIYPYSGFNYNEFINNSETYTDWVKKEHPTDLWYNSYFQIITALFCMKKYFNMSHMDLHSDNILVKRIKTGGHWTYIINKKEYKVPNLGYIFYIIDLGHALIPNVFNSWFISEKYKYKIIGNEFDINNLFKSTQKKSTLPDDVKYDIKYIISKLKHNHSFYDILSKIWDQKYVYDNTGKIKQMKTINIDTYNTDTILNTDNILTEIVNFI